MLTINKITKYKLEFTVFVCGAVVMILELVGSRVVSPYFGNSLYIWTALIGIIMASLSFGYYLGGKASDRIQDYRSLSRIIALSGLLIGVTAFIKEPILKYFSDNMDDLRYASFFSILFLFSPASILLAMVSPFAAKIRLKNLKVSGQTVGTLYAVSTAGSIAGTFLAGYYLIPFLGNLTLLFVLAVTLIALSLLIDREWIYKLLFLLIILSLLYLSIYRSVFRMNVLADIDSQYNRIIVSEEEYGQDKIIALKTDNSGIQSAVFADSEKNEELVVGYLKEFKDVSQTLPNIENALLIGGAGFTFPAHFLKEYPDAKIDVIEIDPQMHEVATRFFNFKEDSRISIITEDARLVPKMCNTEYDIIFLDAFGSLSPPYYLTTQEFFNSLKAKCLSQEGIMVINMISAIEGKDSGFLKSEYNTLRSVFSGVFIYPVYNQVSIYKTQNLIAITSNNSPKPKIDRFFLSIRESKEILTDDHAPVEYLTSGFSGI